MTDEQIIERCKAAGIKWIPPQEDEDDPGAFPGSFDMVSMAEMRALLSASIADTATNYVPEDAQIESEARLYSLDLANGLDWCFDDFNLKAFVRALFLQRGEK